MDLSSFSVNNVILLNPGIGSILRSPGRRIRQTLDLVFANRKDEGEITVRNRGTCQLTSLSRLSTWLRRPSSVVGSRGSPNSTTGKAEPTINTICEIVGVEQAIRSHTSLRVPYQPKGSYPVCAESVKNPLDNVL
tara:strand:- start:3305 stop:3709 length:405 start_codon:yes stop_codon:yes gene_type:complete